MSEPTHLVVRNARVHNLRGVDVTVPRHALVVFTGVSGSGKSSLVFDTIYQEGQRRYLDSLSSYARQFLGQLERPEVDLVEGVSPTLAIDQKTVNRNPRSTVGTVTELHDHLRLLFARLGTPRCPICATPISRLGTEAVVDAVLAEGEGQRVQILAPVVVARKGEYRKEMAGWARDGWLRARVDGAMVRLDEPPELERYVQHTIEIVVDRLVPSPSDRTRLAEAVETATALAGSTVVVLIGDDTERTFSTARACPQHPEQVVPELEPRLFSFNAPQGACPTCHGLGVLDAVDPARVLDASLPLPGAVLALNDDGKIPFARVDVEALVEVARKLGADPAKPVATWSGAQRHALLHGDVRVSYGEPRSGGRRRPRPWEGLLTVVDRAWTQTRFPPLARFRAETTCPDCHGTRLSPIARAVTFRDRGIAELGAMTVGSARAFFEDVALGGDEREVGELLLSEIQGRLRFLDEVGLSYLSLSRSAATLSGGEAQRIRLASQVGSGLQGVTYVLDEPSIGLHPRDNARLLGAVLALRDRGNSLLVVEHDADTILAADWVVDVGPGAGREGGHILASGPPAAVLASDGLTGRYLRGELRAPVPDVRRPVDGPALVVRGARHNNLCGVDVRFPLGAFTVVTGVSGSGKSSLVFQVLEESVTGLLAGTGGLVGCEALEGLEQVDKIVRINQRPIGRTPRSNPATYTGAMDLVRDLFAATPEAKARGYSKSRFSFNVKGGRCEDCGGAGVKTVEMQFLPDVSVPCETCGGKRFNRETLDIRYKGLTISEVLDLPIGEALALFGRHRKLARILQVLVDVGLDYVTLGQPSTTLSGGEAQRVKLASELHRPATGRTLYLLDEPTTGLHFHDVSKLLIALQRLVDQGNTVIVVEHHTDVMRAADHLIDLGPEGGDGGGSVVAEGTPEALARCDTPTGRALAAEASRAAPDLVAEPPAPAVARSVPAAIVLQGARKHNLQDIDVRIPHGLLTVVTGPSGSGKTSLAFDTVFAEGQRRYVESLSTYARRFLGRLERAPLTRAEGLQPAIAIDQSASRHNPRSTVATVTEIHDMLRLLYARVGTPHCPHCPPARETVLTASSPSSVARQLAEVDEAGWIVATLAPDPAPEERAALLARDGWTRLLVDGAEVGLDDAAATGPLRAGATLVLDRVKPSSAAPSRLSEAVAHAYRLGEGQVAFLPRSGGPARRFTEGLVCPFHGPVLPEITPRHFSFNARIGMCEHCEGLGVVSRAVPEDVIRGGGPLSSALSPPAAALLGRSAVARQALHAVLAREGHTPETPVSAWSPTTWARVLQGSSEPVEVTRRQGRKVVQDVVTWPGLVGLLAASGEGVSWTRVDVPCPACGGGRLRPEVLAVTLGGQSIHAFSSLTVGDALEVATSWPLEGAAAAIAERARDELLRRLRFLLDVGLGYLTLDREASTLSGGEAQRIRLASQLGAGLTGVTYVLDEPTVGLHPRDTERLLGTLEGLRDAGNTVLVVEHDPDTIRRADHVIDMGPGAGRHGGRVIAAGTPAEIAADPQAPTGRWLAGLDRMPAFGARREGTGRITLVGPRANNLQVPSVSVPTGAWTAVTGVSGSGKSSLIMDTLAPALQARAGQSATGARFDDLVVDVPYDGVVVVDQLPLGRTPRSTPATYLGIMDRLRVLFSETAGARARGWGPGRFTFNTPGGRCEACEGRGAQLVEMHFLPDVWVICDSCRGRRFSRETLEVRWRGLNLAEVLALRADEAVETFSAHRALRGRLQALVDVGLGYMTLGQPATTLSGGEAQRVKLAAELVSRAGHRIYVLDEPTTGLHLGDVRKLVEVLRRLVEQGHTVLTIEHHLDMIAAADHVVELGPEGGAAGGRLIAQGTPEQVAAADTPTGRALAPHLAASAEGAAAPAPARRRTGRPKATG